MENLELAVRAVKEAFPGMKLLEQEPMSAHSSFRIGGPARVIAYPQDVTSFSRLCSILKEHHIAPFILGNGTNILFPDEGLQNLFLVSTENLQKIFLLPDGAIYAEAGVSLARLSMFAQENGLRFRQADIWVGAVPGREYHSGTFLLSFLRASIVLTASSFRIGQSLHDRSSRGMSASALRIMKASKSSISQNPEYETVDIFLLDAKLVEQFQIIIAAKEFLHQFHASFLQGIIHQQRAKYSFQRNHDRTGRALCRNRYAGIIETVLIGKVYLLSRSEHRTERSLQITVRECHQATVI